jgi:CheY-like chemotaxis protein
MAKIMLVEDDNNLREIYEARLLAEGYEIVAAKDGEEALALAVKERPDLIISDVMMPKISGFDMLDILRSTAETKDTKVIMMTALSQAEDKTRADKLGADRYLVKSQVTLEDVAKVARDVLAGDNGDSPAEPSAGAPDADAQPALTTASPDPVVTPTPVVDEPANTPDPTLPAPASEPTTVSPTPVPVQDDPADAPVSMPPVTNELTPTPDPVPAPNDPTEPEPSPVPAPEPAGEESKEMVTPEAPTEPEPAPTAANEVGGIKTDLTQTTAQEEQAIENQISEIFAEPVTEDPNITTTPAPGETVTTAPPSVSPQLQTPEESSGDALNTDNVVQPVEVAEAPAEPAVTEVTTPPTPEQTPEVVAPTMTPAPTPEVSTVESSSSVPIGGKKVIQPINDMSAGPDINDLLQKESDSAAVPPPPATSVVSPGGQTVIPVTTDTPDEPASDTKQPGNVISPNDIAL